MNDIVHTSPVVDELVTPDGAVVLVRTGRRGHRVVRLSVLGQLIRELATSGIPMDRLARDLEARLGRPAGSDAWLLTVQSVAAMEADGLVSTRPRDQTTLVT